MDRLRYLLKEFLDGRIDPKNICFANQSFKKSGLEGREVMRQHLLRIRKSIRCSALLLRLRGYWFFLEFFIRQWKFPTLAWRLPIFIWMWLAFFDWSTWFLYVCLLTFFNYFYWLFLCCGRDRRLFLWSGCDGRFIWKFGENFLWLVRSFFTCSDFI